jgi:hypothetical protein
MWKKSAIDELQYVIVTLFEGTERNYGKFHSELSVSWFPENETGLPILPRNSFN